MKSFKSWLEANMGSAGIDQTPTNTASQSNAIAGDFFANAPQGPDLMGDLTASGTDNTQLRRQVPDIAAQAIQFAGQDAKRAQLTPVDMMRSMGTEVFGKKLPSYFRSFAHMLKKMKK